ncbi:lysophospholipid acyltransferase 5 [Orussus abietinus]|uniref:lysophospholipid acyltransferase 5 n=1 Tax=Orussus abietinus TaxID=222816 RepID=UPI0006262EA0|nr:lysophospholipid acyltransferase 5 [Orussus abietinus]
MAGVAEKSVDWAEGGISRIANIVNAPEAAVRLLCSIILGFPFALIHRYALYGKNPNLQHIYFIVCGFTIGYWNYEWNVLHSASAVCVTYLTLKALGGTIQAVVITFVYNMIHLMIGYYTTSTLDYDIKWTMPQCVLTLRLIGLALDIYDGQKPKDKLSSTQQKTALNRPPTFLETAAFVYFPGSFLVGPQFSMKRYLDFVNCEFMKEDQKGESTQPLPPNSLNAGFRRAFLGVVYIGLYQIGTLYISNDYVVSAEFLQQGFLQRCFLLGLWGRINLYKYISCWLLTEGVCIVFGITYNGKDDQGHPRWDGCSNVHLLTFENATKFNHYIESFNTNTNHWCAEYIYKRVKFLGSKLYSQIVTLSFLAIWHGFHSGYYLCFLMEFIVIYSEKGVETQLAKNEALQAALENPIFRLATWVLLKIYTLVFMGYSLIPFVLLSYDRYLPVYASVYYCGHIFFLSYPVLAPLINPLLRGKPSKPHQQ